MKDIKKIQVSKSQIIWLKNIIEIHVFYYILILKMYLNLL